MELQSNVEKIRAEGLGVAAISYDSVAVLKSFAERRGITFPLLSDPESKIIRDFGIFNEQSQEGTMQYGIPYPGTYLVDCNRPRDSEVLRGRLHPTLHLGRHPGQPFWRERGSGADRSGG